jgi:uncharacterized membrane protein YfcA
MYDALNEALTYPGLVWVILGAFIAGAVRGFSGFGTALVFLPIAGSVMPPVWALIVLTVMDSFGPLPTLRRTVKSANLPDVRRLWIGMVIALPMGLMVLTRLEPEIFRYIVSIAALLVPMLLLAGLRYRGPMTPSVIYGAGGISGFLGGVAGVPGPPVILLYMASPSPPALIRANTMIYLFLFDLTLLAFIAATGQLETVPVMIGLLMALPTMLGTVVGTAIFNPDKAHIYRGAGYLIVMASALRGLPIWG